MDKSHAADRGSEEPTPAQLKELFAQIEKGRVTKESLQRFLRGSVQPVTVEMARRIMGEKNFFGPEEWRRFFGEKFQLANIPEIPWMTEELASPGINQKHFLFLGLESLDGKPLNLSMWHEVYSDTRVHPRFFHNWYLGNRFAQKTCCLRWYLMTAGIVEGSASLTYSGQEAILPQQYEIPSAIERVNANILYCLLNGKYLDENFWARTCDTTDGGDRVSVRGYSGDGLYVSNWHDFAYSDVGVPASRKFQG